jgi:hypothetical protein
MESGVTCSVKGYELVGHDTSSTINQAMLLKGIELESIGEMNAVC